MLAFPLRLVTSSSSLAIASCCFPHLVSNALHLNQNKDFLENRGWEFFFHELGVARGWDVSLVFWRLAVPKVLRNLPEGWNS